MGKEGAHPVESGRGRHHRFQGQPFVEHQRVVAIALVEGVERGETLVEGRGRQDRQRRQPVGHVVRRDEAGNDPLDRFPVTVGDGERQGAVGEGPPSGRCGIGREGPAVGHRLDHRPEPRADAIGDRLPQGVARRGDRVRVDVATDLAGDIRFAGEKEDLGPEGRFEGVVLGDLAEGVDQRRIDRARLACTDRRGSGDQRAVRQHLRRPPAVERIGVGPQQEEEFIRRQVDRQLHRRREAAEQRRDRGGRDSFEDDGLARLGEMDDVVDDAGPRRRVPGEVGPVRPDETEAHGHVHRLLRALAGGRRRRLRQRQRIAALLRVEAAAGGDLRRAGLAVPELEPGKVGAGRVGEGGEEILDRHRLAVVALEIEVHALAEAVLAEDRLQHAHHLGALLVDGRGVEVVDLGIDLRPDRMGEGAAILGELPRLERAHVGDALDRPRAHVGGELLVAIDRQAFLEAELEPVAAGDAVAGPVVEVLMGDDALDMGEVVVGRRVEVGQDVLVVEDVEALVLHRPHVEVRHRHDHEDVEIVFAAEGGLVPAHRPLQRIHRIGAARLLAVLAIDAQRHRAA